MLQSTSRYETKSHTILSLDGIFPDFIFHKLLLLTLLTLPIEGWIDGDLISELMMVFMFIGETLWSAATICRLITSYKFLCAFSYFSIWASLTCGGPKLVKPLKRKFAAEFACDLYLRLSGFIWIFPPAAMVLPTLFFSSTPLTTAIYSLMSRFSLSSHFDKKCLSSICIS